MTEHKTEEKFFDTETSDINEEFNEFEEKNEAPIEASQENEMTLDNMMNQTQFIKLPGVGQTESYVIESIKDNPKTTGKNKTTGEEFIIGVKKKDGEVIRRDVHTDKGCFTITSWQLFFKFFGPESEMLKIMRERAARNGDKTPNGIKVEITKHYNGNYAMKPVAEIAKLMDMTEEEATAYKKEVADALKNGGLFTTKFSE